MSLAEVLPDVKSLSRIDKFRLIQFLAEELAHDESCPIELGKSYPVWSPESAFPAAEAMLQALKADSSRP